MVSSLTRRLLRDWKNITRYNATFADRSHILFHLKPQDSNLHIWHLVLYDPASSIELYLKLHIGNEEEPVIIMRCLTPNTLYPTNRNISLTHLNYYLTDYGLVTFLQQVWRMFFSVDRNERTMGCNDKSRLFFAWNRIICKDFKKLFPELLGTLAPGDYEMVKSYYHSNSTDDRFLSRHFSGMANDDKNSVSENICTAKDLIACDGNYHVPIQLKNCFVRRRSHSDLVHSDDQEFCESSAGSVHHKRKKLKR